MRRGLTALLDWLEQQPGRTWQDRWLASGAEAAGRAWTDLVRREVPSLAARPAGHVRTDLLTAMRLMLTGQVLRPGYAWLLRYRPSVLLEEARSRIDPAGFARLRAHFDATGRRNPQDRKEALNRITWILLNKGGLIRDITIGDCIELSDALQEHQCPGSQQPAPVLCAAGRDRRAARRRPADPAGDQDDRAAHPRRARRQVRPAGASPCGNCSPPTWPSGPPNSTTPPWCAMANTLVRPVLAGPGTAPPRYLLAAPGHRGRRRLEGTAQAGPGPGRATRSATGPPPAASC